MSTIGRPRALASCQANHMTTAPTTTIRRTNSGNDSTGCSWRTRATRVRNTATAYPTTANAPMNSVKAS